LGSYRLIRGGSWDYNAFSARCGYSYWVNPEYADNNYGFRAVCR
jgi:formylglycine-generating enzyme required for sulfatase activity